MTDATKAYDILIIGSGAAAYAALRSEGGFLPLRGSPTVTRSSRRALGLARVGIRALLVAAGDAPTAPPPSPHLAASSPRIPSYVVTPCL